MFDLQGFIWWRTSELFLPSALHPMFRMKPYRGITSKEFSDKKKPI
ncbi:hypothetical protein QG37_03148 [Candidozyma auris]|nr:hypothetical protein QG37_03148 [[Candida] auris]